MNAEKRIDDLELALYDVPACYERARILFDEATVFFFDQVLPYYNLAYFNPGEPEARGPGGIVVPLTGIQADLWTDEEEKRMIENDWRVPEDLFWARLRVQQAKDVIEDGWQFNLKEPEGETL